MAIEMSEGDFSGFWDVFRIILAFFLGAVISGMIIGERAFYLRKRYSYIIFAISVLIIFPYFLEPMESVVIFAFVMGLQNGMVATYRGVIVRMTHMTGNVTDLGVYVGNKIRGNKKIDNIAGLIPFVALISFISGGILGVLLYNQIHNMIFFIVSGLYIILGISYLIFRNFSDDKNLNDVPDALEEAN